MRIFLATLTALGFLVGGALVLPDASVLADHSGDVDCDDFATQAEAQEHYREHPADPDDLDADEDNIACEDMPNVPCPCDTTPVQTEASATPEGTATDEPTATADDTSVPAELEAAVEAAVEARGQTYAGLCEDIEQSEHVGEWCAFVLSLTDTEANVSFGAVLSDELDEVTFTKSGNNWILASATQTPTPAASQPSPTPTPTNVIRAPSTGDGGLR